MARPVHKKIENEGWDAAANDNYDLIFDTPLPFAEYANAGALPAANLYDECVAVVTGVGLYISLSNIWVPIPTRGAAVSDVASLAAESNFTDSEDNVNDVRTVLNDLLASLRASKAIDI